MLARDGWKLIEKLIGRFAFFKTVEQVLNRNSCSAKDGSAAHLLWIHFDQALQIHSSHLNRQTSADVFLAITSISL